METWCVALRSRRRPRLLLLPALTGSRPPNLALWGTPIARVVLARQPLFEGKEARQLAARSAELLALMQQYRKSRA